MSVEITIKEGLSKAFQDLFEFGGIAEDGIQLQPTKKEFDGDYTFVTFPFVKLIGKNPFQLADELGQYLTTNLDVVSGYNVVKGFLNIELNANSWLTTFNNLFVSESLKSSETKEKVMVEYSSPNTNKPLHLGHLRNNFLGFSISNILVQDGYQVTKANLINDRGIHICKSMIAYERFGNGETPESSGLKGDHLIGKYYVIFDQEYKKEIEALVAEGVDKEEAKKQAPLMLETQEMLQKWEQGDEQVRSLWKKLNDWVYEGFNATYKSIGVEFDQFYYESDTYLLGKDLVEEGLDKGAFFKKEDNSVWADLSDEGLDQKLVLRGDGTSVYITQDMGTADLKYEDYSVDKSVYVVGNEQDYHFDVLKKILKKLERPYAEGVYHMSYGMVDLPSGKMKSREGTVVDADDLINDMIETAKQRTLELGKIDGFTDEEANKLFSQLALGALKYFILKVDPKKRMLFNPEDSIDFQGNTGPFIQYTFARISAILRRAEELKIDFSAPINNYELSETETNLIYLMTQSGKKITESATNYAPSVVAAHVYDIAKEFNRFYSERPIFKEENQENINFRLQVCKTVANHIGTLMGLLGIEVPSKM